MNDLTLIVALRCDDFSFYSKRLALRDELDLDRVSTIVVDDGSPQTVSDEIAEFCRFRGYQYIRLETEFAPFSLARARNVGIQAADTKWICFEDADLAYDLKHYQKLRRLLRLLPNLPMNFITVPAIYLSESLTEDVFNDGSIQPHIDRAICGMCFEDPTGSPENTDIQYFAPASSVIALEKKTALYVGGFNEAFVGWGGEDRDFVYRLLQFNDQLEKPEVFDATKNWNLNDTVVYEGWRSLYRIHGDFASRHGLYAFHLFHEKLEWRADQSANNLGYAKELAKYYWRTKRLPSDYDRKRKPAVILGLNPHIYNPQLLSVIDNPWVVDEKQSEEPTDFAVRIINANPERVFIWNPYGTMWRLDVYRELKANNVPVVVVERGALPNSLYFDAGGFCAESASYQEENWPLIESEEQEELVTTYIENLRYSDNTLEKQSQRIGAPLLRLKLGIPSETKVFFCAFQMDTDTVTTQFVEEGREYEQFVLEVKRLALSLPKDWVLVYKNHPLSPNKVEIPSAICADQFHIHDVLEVSDAVGLYNSGVGVIAMAFEKPVYYFGRCFYAVKGINKRWTNTKSVAADLPSIPRVDRDKVKRFYNFLLNEFYSFADWTYVDRKRGNGSVQRVLDSIKFSTIAIPGVGKYAIERPQVALRRSTLFDVYRHFDVQKRRSRRQKPAPRPKPVANAPKPQPAKSTPVAANSKHNGSAYKSKVRKLKRDPHAFFRDSKFFAFRPVKHLFPAT